MKTKIILMIILLSIIVCLEPNDDSSSIKYILFSDENIKISEGKITVSGTSVILEEPGIYLITGESNEGNIVIKSSSVKLYLQNLKLSSKITAPIIVTSNLKDVKIIVLQNTILKDLESPKTIEGECAVVKIKKNSVVSFENHDVFTLYGECKNIIRGESQVSIIFEKSMGEYIINAYKAAISADGLLEFNGGKFTIISDFGDAIKSTPEDYDNESLGKILINDGIFNIQCYNDAFTAKNHITIVKGKFEIKTENGYDSTTYDENESAKGFKLSSDVEGAEIKIYSGDFEFNTADDAFHSNRDITILGGNFIINSKDDGICAKYKLEIGKKNSKLYDLSIKILNSYEALEGMNIVIYSGRISVTSENDGINSSGVVKKNQTRTRRHRNNTNETSSWNETERRNRTNDKTNNRTNRYNRTDENGKKKHIGTPGNSSYSISIFGGEIYVYSASDGIDSNGNVFIHGGSISIFSKGSGTDEPIDHNGNLTLFNGEVLGVGCEGIESVHEGIMKGNQIYAFYSGAITKDKILEIKNEKDELVKEGLIDRDITYIFYTSPELNEDYNFYLYDKTNDLKEKLNITFNYPENGLDDEDVKYGNGMYDSDSNGWNNKNNNENNKNEINSNEKNSSYSNKVKSAIIGIFILLILV